MKSSRFFLKRAALLLGATMALVSASFTLASCMTEDTETILPEGIEQLEDTDPLVGTWNGQYEGESYTITATTFTSAGSYEGDNLLVGKLNTSSGYIYIKYTRAMNPDWSYSEDAPDVGKWYAVMYKDLTERSISISGAWKKDGISAAETLEEAIAEFTVENGYFDSFSECTKN
ncbi:MAG: hypothetical protein K2H09_06120 [Treponemataceae bacterium]|nr:hypothetical protein [Treponemataceae bacterium]